MGQQEHARRTAGDADPPSTARPRAGMNNTTATGVAVEVEASRRAAIDDMQSMAGVSVQ